MVHSPEIRGDGIVAENFSVVYDGPAMQEHRIPVTALAPALMALSEMFQAAHREISDGFTPAPGLDVVAHVEGSFDVQLILDAGSAAVDILSSPEISAAANTVGLLSPVVGALRWIQHRRQVGRIVREEIEPVRAGEIRVRWPDGTDIECPESAAALVESMDFRRSARRALAPLEGDGGIDSIAIRPESEEAPAVVLHREDSRALDEIPGDETVVADTEREIGLRPLKPSFEEGYKWWVSDGSRRFWVEMHDLNFINRVVSSSESFSAGDVLRCRLRERQIEDSNGDLRVENLVTEVLSHQRRPPPDPLPFEE